MHVLVTGGAGYIGSHVVERLLGQGCQVTVLDNFDPFYSPEIKRLNLTHVALEPGFRLVAGSLMSPWLLDEVFRADAVDAVVHLAARADVRTMNNRKHLEVNTAGTLWLLEAMQKHGCRDLVMASTSAVYGNGSDAAPLSETDLTDSPLNAYAASKKAAELFAYTYGHLHGIRTIALRYFTVVGKRQRPDMALALFTRAIERGEPVYVYGDGNLIRDYTHVDDITEGTVAALNLLRSTDRDTDTPPFSLLNLGSGKETRLIDFVGMVADAVGKEPNIHLMPTPKQDIRVLKADITRAKTVLGYSPQKTVEEAVHEYVEWSRKNIDND
jgi:UDP-glucuronate 4-epimerase